MTDLENMTVRNDELRRSIMGIQQEIGTLKRCIQRLSRDHDWATRQLSMNECEIRREEDKTI